MFKRQVSSVRFIKSHLRISDGYVIFLANVMCKEIDLHVKLEKNK